MIFIFESLGLLPRDLHSQCVHLSLPPLSRVVSTSIWWCGTTKGALVFLFSDSVCDFVFVVVKVRKFLLFVNVYQKTKTHFYKNISCLKVRWCDTAWKLLVFKSPWMSNKQSYCRMMVLKLTTVCVGNLRWLHKKYVSVCRMSELSSYVLG